MEPKAMHLLIIGLTLDQVNMFCDLAGLTNITGDEKAQILATIPAEATTVARLDPKVDTEQRDTAG
jgi:hypothetical protein